MNLRNNNREIIKSLAAKSYRFNCGRNRVLICAVALAIVVVFGVLTLAAGRLDAEKLSGMRDAGVTSSYSLENPTEEQYQKIQTLSYVGYAGREWNFGTALDNKVPVFYCCAVTEESFHTLYAPAVTDIQGNYPKDNNEVMLSVGTLEDMGIEKPKLGMKLRLELSLEDKTISKTFTLCGYFTDYKVGYRDLSKGFFSTAMTSREEADLLRIVPTQVLSKQERQEEFLKALRKDAGITGSQQIEGYFGGYIAEYDPAGGYGGAGCLIVLLLLSAVLLINNVTYISIKRDVRHYGLLKTLGATQKQVEKILLRQVVRIAAIGTFFGTMVSILLVLFVFPAFIQTLYLSGYGPAGQLIGFRPLWLLLTILLVFLTTVFSAMEPARKVSRASLIEAQGNMDKKKKPKSTCSSNKGGHLSRQAWRNAFQNKRKAAVTIFSLTLGILIALTAVVITEGQNDYWDYDEGTDIEISTFYRPGIYGEEQIDKETEAQIRAISGIRTITCTYGDFFRLDEKDAMWKSFSNMDSAAILVDQTYLAKLGAYAAEKGLKIDMHGLKKGESAVEIYANRRTKEQGKAEQIGDAFHILDGKGRGLGKLKFAGYLNRNKKDFPDTPQIMHSLDTPIFLMTEKGFARAGLKKRIQDMSISVEPKAEAKVQEQLDRILQKRNKQLRKTLFQESGGEPDVLRFSSKSEAYAENQAAMRATRIMGYGMSALLILMGIMNYAHIVITGIFSRRHDFALLECVGMTRKQLRRLLMMEGCYYAAITAALSLILGTAAIFAAASYMKNKYYTFQFSYPWVEMLGIFAILFLLSMIIPLFLYRKQERESIVGRLSESHR